MPEQTRCEKEITITGNRFDQSSILLHEDNGTKIKLKICNLRHNTVTSMFAALTMLASTILTDAILFNHEGQEEYKMNECNKLFKMKFQVSDHKKFLKTAFDQL